MTLSPELKDILACPRCKGPLSFREDQGEIRCGSCRLAYPIRDGIPVMLIDEARDLQPGEGSGESP